MSGGEWFPLFFDVVDHERIAGADLTHLPKASREVMREAMFGLYVRALRDLQRARSNDGLLTKHALWGPAEARRGIAEELERVGMLEVREGRYYPRNYLEKNRSGDQIRKATGAATERQRLSRAAKAAAAKGGCHTDVTRDMSVTPACASLSVSGVVLEGVQGEPESAGPRETYVSAATGSTPPPPDIPITPELEDACVMAGAPKPTREHVQLMLTTAAGRGKTSLDWPREVVAWMLRQRQFDRGGPHLRAVPDAPPAPYHGKPPPLPCPFCAQRGGQHRDDCAHPMRRRKAATL